MWKKVISMTTVNQASVVWEPAYVEDIIVSLSLVRKFLQEHWFQNSIKAWLSDWIYGFFAQSVQSSAVSLVWKNEAKITSLILIWPLMAAHLTSLQRPRKTMTSVRIEPEFLRREASTLRSERPVFQQVAALWRIGLTIERTCTAAREHGSPRP